MNYNGQLTPTDHQPSYKQPTIQQRLEIKQKQLTESLEEVNAALDALNVNPELSGMLNAISKINV